MKPGTLILRTAGTNCDVETAHAFELAGASAERVHLNRVLERPALLGEYQMLAFPGGFSYGDDIAAGRILANQIVHHLRDAVRAFVDAGKPVIGVCNGFQVLIKTDLLPGELVHIVDVTNGARLETYTIAGERGSGVLGINGAAARLVHPGDVVILIAYGQMETAEAKEFQPSVVFVDADNKIVGRGSDPAEALPGSGLVRGDLHTFAPSDLAAGR